MEDSRFSTFILLGSAIIMATILALPSEGSSSLIMWVIHRVGVFADTLFHEMGHAVFGWLYGMPMIPMIFTVIGADQAGGMTIPLGPRTWFMQIVALVLLAAFCKRLRSIDSYYFYPFTLLFIFIAITCASGYHSEVISYMGHGGAVLAAGILLFKAFANVNMRSSVERWLNAFFGFFLILDNFFFSYGLIFNKAKKFEYTTHQAFGTSHNDFVAITHTIPSLTVDNIAWFTIFLCIAMVVIAAYLTYKVYDEVEVMEDQEVTQKIDELKNMEEPTSNF